MSIVSTFKKSLIRFAEQQVIGFMEDFLYHAEEFGVSNYRAHSDSNGVTDDLWMEFTNGSAIEIENTKNADLYGLSYWDSYSGSYVFPIKKIMNRQKVSKLIDAIGKNRSSEIFSLLEETPEESFRILQVTGEKEMLARDVFKGELKKISRTETPEIREFIEEAREYGMKDYSVANVTDLTISFENGISVYIAESAPDTYFMHFEETGVEGADLIPAKSRLSKEKVLDLIEMAGTNNAKGLHPLLMEEPEESYTRSIYDFED